MSASPRIQRLPDPDKTYRVAQWATGRIGTRSLRELIRSPQMKLVGVYVHSDSKEGRDAGELCDLPPVGLAATRDIQKIIAAKPDCVVAYMEGVNIDDVCRFLEAGINIVTSRVDFLEPDRMKPDIRRRTEEACRKGGASIYSTGASPGFSSEALPLVLASMSRRMDRMLIDEFADIPASCPDFQVIRMGYGKPAGKAFDPVRLAHASHGFEQSVNVIAKGLGITLDDFDLLGENAHARERFVLPGGTPIEKGTVAAQRITVTGMQKGKPLICYRVNWYCTTHLDRDWDLRRSGWRVLVEGETPLDVNVTFPVSGDQVSPAMAGITANRVISAVPYVCEAEPGICTTADLPNIVPKMG